MSTLLIVPNYVAAEINASIDKALAGRPCSDEERLHIYNMILLHFDRHGSIPDFRLEARSQPMSQSALDKEK